MCLYQIIVFLYFMNRKFFSQFFHSLLVQDSSLTLLDDSPEFSVGNGSVLVVTLLALRFLERSE